MEPTVAEFMQTNVFAVSPGITVPQLERELVSRRVSGLPVMERGELVGVVTRSDVLRRLCVERSQQEVLSDYYYDHAGFRPAVTDLDALTEIAQNVGLKVDKLLVGDVMERNIITIREDAPLSRAAKLLVSKHIHRLPVIGQHGELLGIISTLDLVRRIAEPELTDERSSRFA